MAKGGVIMSILLFILFHYSDASLVFACLLFLFSVLFAYGLISISLSYRRIKKIKKLPKIPYRASF
ncbi:hypothetical protein HCW_01320 [Helicobacter cetorum MIT 00-7128]|uniref:Uncharacterized protein n=1 Tax=Helicobacter cetorum (strain ATCC BAA-429 / MIT 00-7128) TaxID=182217 RepID=I0EKT4_HELC0|nr:hypothetical protein HCW_01320 [Helicobacter cetorum MIT 00-7128]